MSSTNMPMEEDVKRHFITVGDRQVHYLRAGKGPCVVLCHGSPQSATFLLPLMHVLKERYTVLALDTPGNGLSDPIGNEDASIADYADALADTLTALGIEQTALYGHHTGGATVVAFAKTYPERATMVIADGFPVFSEDETALMLEKYLPAFKPSWDGSHLCWLWARIQEQLMFFPWHEHDLDHRWDYSVAPPEAITAACLDLLRPGDAYRTPYRAALTFNPHDVVKDITVPTILFAQDFDMLFPHLDRLGDVSESVRIQRFGSDRAEAYAWFADTFSEHPAPSPPAAPPVIGEGLLQDYVNAPHGQFYVRKRLGTGKPIIALHGPGASSKHFDEMVASRAGRRPVYAIDLPGHGETPATLNDGEHTIPRYAKIIVDVLQVLVPETCDIIGDESGGYIGLEVARLKSALVDHVILVGAADVSGGEWQEVRTHYIPDLSPRWDGAHFLSAWRMTRFKRLFWPWYDMTRDHIIWDEPQLDEEDLHLHAVDLIKSYKSFPEAMLSYLTYQTQKALNHKQDVSVYIAQHRWDVVKDKGAEIAQKTNTPMIELPDNQSDWLSYLEDLTD